MCWTTLTQCLQGFQTGANEAAPYVKLWYVLVTPAWYLLASDRRLFDYSILIDCMAKLIPHNSAQVMSIWLYIAQCDFCVKM